MAANFQVATFSTRRQAVVCYKLLNITIGVELYFRYKIKYSFCSQTWSVFANLFLFFRCVKAINLVSKFSGYFHEI